MSAMQRHLSLAKIFRLGDAATTGSSSFTYSFITLLITNNTYHISLHHTHIRSLYSAGSFLSGSTAVADPLFDESWCISGCSARGTYPCGFSPCFICIFLSCFSMTCTLSSTVLSTFSFEFLQPIVWLCVCWSLLMFRSVDKSNNWK